MMFCQPHDAMGPETAVNFQRPVGHPLVDTLNDLKRFMLKCMETNGML